MKRKKYNEELNIASGTEMMRASRQRPVTFKDKSKYNRKKKHKNRHDSSGDSFFIYHSIRENNIFPINLDIYIFHQMNL